jgi:hypothetical protein
VERHGAAVVAASVVHLDRFQVERENTNSTLQPTSTASTS